MFKEAGRESILLSSMEQLKKASARTARDAHEVLDELVSCENTKDNALLLKGALCFYGIGVPANPKEAVRLFSMAAYNGCVNAKYNLAVLLESGIGIKQNNAEAARLYTEAGAAGCMPAWCNLGLCYLNGRGVPTDFMKAGELLQRAADSGNGIAYHNLAICYSLGMGKEKNLSEALRCYYIAGFQGLPPAWESLSVILEEGLGDIHTDHREAWRCKRCSKAGSYDDYLSVVSDE